MAKKANDVFYHSVIHLVKGVFKAQGLKFNVTGAENIPDTGAVVVANHTGYMDFTYVGLPFYTPYSPRTARNRKRLVRFMAKREVWDNPIGGPVMSGMKHIPVDRIDTVPSYNKAVEDLKAGELVGVFPEGTLSRSFEIKKLRTGAVRMAREAGVPIVPVILVGSQRVWPKDGPKHLGRSNTPIEINVLPAWYPPEGPADEVTKQLRHIMADGLAELWQRYDELHGPLPQGAPWVPARYGGGALTLEEAQKLDDAVQNERRRVRTLRDDLDALADKLNALLAGLGEASKELVVQSKDAANHTAQTVATAKTAIEQLAEDAVEGVKEGVSKVASAGSRLRQLSAQIPTNVPPAAVDALNQLVSDAKQIRDRLPHRVRARLTEFPEALVTDVDGTIFYQPEGSTTRVVTESTRNAFLDMRTRGKCTFLATGRTPRELPEVFQALGFAPIVVAANGTLVVDGAKLPAELSESTDISDAILHTDGFTTDDAATVREAINATRSANAGGPIADLVMDEERVNGHIIKYTARADVASADIVAAITEHLGDVATVNYSAPWGYAEISPAGVTKATGLKWLLSKKGIDPARVVAFGDMPNDIDMLAYVGTGVAMGNADPAVIAQAQWVTSPVTKDGVSEFLAPVFQREETPGQV